MRKFEAGERKFKANQVVYVVTKPHYGVRFATINTYLGRGKYMVDYYCIKECRLINGIPFDEVDFSKEYPLPKKWSYDTVLFELSYTDEYDEIMDFLVSRYDKENFTEALKRGYIVKREEVFQGYVSTEIFKSTYKLVKKHRSTHNPMYWTHEDHHEDYIFNSYEDARSFAAANLYKERKENEMLNAMSDEEWSWYDINRVLDRCEATPEDREQVIKIIKQGQNLPPIEELEIRYFGGDIQVLSDSGKYETIYHLRDEEVKQPKEKYYVSAHYIWDLDEEPVIAEFTNDSVKDIFATYGDINTYRLTIGCKMWSLERWQDSPAYYYNGVRIDESGKIHSVLVAHYATPFGAFTEIDGHIHYINLTFERKYGILFDKIHYYGTSSRSDDEMRELVAKKVKKYMGVKADMILEHIKDFKVG